MILVWSDELTNPLPLFRHVAKCIPAQEGLPAGELTALRQVVEAGRDKRTKADRKPKPKPKPTRTAAAAASAGAATPVAPPLDAATRVVQQLVAFQAGTEPAKKVRPV